MDYVPCRLRKVLGRQGTMKQPVKINGVCYVATHSAGQCLCHILGKGSTLPSCMSNSRIALAFKSDSGANGIAITRCQLPLRIRYNSSICFSPDRNCSCIYSYSANRSILFLNSGLTQDRECPRRNSLKSVYFVRLCLPFICKVILHRGHSFLRPEFSRPLCVPFRRFSSIMHRTALT